MSENFRIFFLNFAPAAIPGLLMLSIALIYRGLQPRPRPMSPEETAEAVRLVTRLATTFNLYKDLTRQHKDTP